MYSRRQVLSAIAGGIAAAPVLAAAQLGRDQNGVPVTSGTQPVGNEVNSPNTLPYTPVVMPDTPTLAYEMDNGVKVFRLVAEPVTREFAPGVLVNCWGYNGQAPGPLIEAVEGDRVRFLVTNNLPEGVHTTIHWHGILLPNGMDGVGGLTQKHIRRGETFKYEFTLRQHGTYMYHPHFDEMLQLGLGMMGMFVVHPRGQSAPKVDRDFAILLNEWLVKPGLATPDPSEMTNFNLFTFNGRMFPGTSPLVARLGDKVRIRIGNLSTTNAHPIHLHGFSFRVTGTDGGPIPEAGQWPEVTVNVPTGAVRDIEFVADAEGDWALHCHKVHHLKNGMEHKAPIDAGGERDIAEATSSKGTTGTIAMAGDMSAMPGMTEIGSTGNTIGSAFPGPFVEIDAGGMFTVVKIRKGITSYDDPGSYKHPAGTVAERIGA